MKVFNTQEDAARDLLRHISPEQIGERLNDVIKLNPKLADELYSTVDVPLEVLTDKEHDGYKFIKCDYNRDCDSWRSPYSNKYDPPLPDGGILPSPAMRKIEEKALFGFETYKKMYFGDSAVLSVYAWDMDPSSFAVGIFVRKDISDTLRDGTSCTGNISCSDVVEVRKANGSDFSYNLVSSILMHCDLSTRLKEPIRLSGGITGFKSSTGKGANEVEHLKNIGMLLEDNASEFTERIRQIFVGKMKEVYSYTKGHVGSDYIERMKKLLAETLQNKFNKQ